MPEPAAELQDHEGKKSMAPRRDGLALKLHDIVMVSLAEKMVADEAFLIFVRGHLADLKEIEPVAIMDVGPLGKAPEFSFVFKERSAVAAFRHRGAWVFLPWTRGMFRRKQAENVFAVFHGTAVHVINALPEADRGINEAFTAEQKSFKLPVPQGIIFGGVEPHPAAPVTLGDHPDIPFRLKDKGIGQVPRFGQNIDRFTPVFEVGR